MPDDVMKSLSVVVHWFCGTPDRRALWIRIRMFLDNVVGAQVGWQEAESYIRGEMMKHGLDESK